MSLLLTNNLLREVCSGIWVQMLLNEKGSTAQGGVVVLSGCLWQQVQGGRG